MSIKANITILNDEKYEKIAKKPITLLFQNKLTLKQKREFFYFLRGYSTTHSRKLYIRHHFSLYLCLPPQFICSNGTNYIRK